MRSIRTFSAPAVLNEPAAGVAVIPPLMGVAAQAMGSQIGSLAVISLCLIYLLYCAFALGRR